MPSVIKVDQIQSDTGTVNVSSNIAFTKPFNTTVGVGVQPSAWQSIYRGVELGLPGAAIAGRTDSVGLNLFSNCYRDSAGTYRYSSAGSAVRVQMDPARIYTFWAGAGSAEGSISFADGPSILPSGIQFPASQNASSDPNTLDDYEEGTWTPSLLIDDGVASNYTNQVGYYRKIGSQVTLWFYVKANTMTGSSLVRIAGLPFSVASNGTGYQPVTRDGLPTISLETYTGTSGQVFNDATTSYYLIRANAVGKGLGGVYTYITS